MLYWAEFSRAEFVFQTLLHCLSYEGTGRSLSLKLIQQLRQKSADSQQKLTAENRSTNTARLAAGKRRWRVWWLWVSPLWLLGFCLLTARTLHEVSLHESIRYAPADPVEKWLNELLCLDCLNIPRLVSGCPLPQTCDLYPLYTKPQSSWWTATTSTCILDSSILASKIDWDVFCSSDCPQPTLSRYYVNRDTLFCYHKASEAFLQRLMALYVASHYKVLVLTGPGTAPDVPPNADSLLSWFPEFTKWSSDVVWRSSPSPLLPPPTCSPNTELSTWGPCCCSGKDARWKFQRSFKTSFWK